MNKLRYLFRLLTGLFWWKWQHLPAGLYVMTYHRIGDRTNTEFDPNVFSCTAEVFEQHLIFYKKYFNVVTPSEIKTGQSFERPTLCITFDDGYADNAEIALPMILKHGLKATFFITSNYVKQQRIPWWDEIAYLVRTSEKSELELKWTEQVSFDLQKVRSDAYALHQMMTQIKSASGLSLDQKLEDIRCLMDVRFDINAQKQPLFMSEDQVKQLAAAGMEIGGHTINHPILSHLTKADQHQEIAQNKKHLTELVDQEIQTFAYPVGAYHCYNQETMQCLQDLNYRLGFTYEPGANPFVADGDFELLRFPVEMNDSVHRLKYMLAFG